MVLVPLAPYITSVLVFPLHVGGLVELYYMNFNVLRCLLMYDAQVLSPCEGSKGEKGNPANWKRQDSFPYVQNSRKGEELLLGKTEDNKNQRGSQSNYRQIVNPRF